jgi:hypothetical protein
MTTDVIFVELKLYETNLATLLTTYELAHKNYIDSIKQKNVAASQMYLTQMNDLNLELLLLMAEISQNIVKINNDEKYAKYKAEIATKMTELNTLYSKMQADQKTIKDLIFDFTDLDGKNATARIQNKANRYSMTLYLFLIGLILFFLIRFSLASEPSPYETVVLVLAILLLIYMYWKSFSTWTETKVIKAGSATTTFITNLLN